MLLGEMEKDGYKAVSSGIEVPKEFAGTTKMEGKGYLTNEK